MSNDGYKIRNQKERTKAPYLYSFNPRKYQQAPKEGLQEGWGTFTLSGAINIVIPPDLIKLQEALPAHSMT